MKKESMTFRLKLEIDELVQTMIGRLPTELFVSDTTTFLDPCMGGGQFIKAVEDRLRQHGHSDANIRKRVFGVEKTQLRVNYAVNRNDLVGTFIVDNADVPAILTTGSMKFDAIVGNPPYQKKVGPKKTEPIWQLFVEQSIKSLTSDGYLCLVHPSGWRNVDGRFKDVGNLITSLDVRYLEIHNERDGLKTFGAETRYDWYVLRNRKSIGKTEVKFQDGMVKTLDLTKLPFVPNGSFDAVMRLIAKPGEKTCQVIYDRSEYGTDKDNVAEKKTSKFCHPVVYTVANGDVVNLYYSSERKGHFGTPKLIWSNGRIVSIGTIVDDTGEYGLTQFAYALVDTPANLPKIKKAFDNPKFRELMTQCSPGDLTLNRRVLALFRKDFWKDFV